MSAMKRGARKLLRGLVRLGDRTRVGQLVNKEIVTTAMGEVKEVEHDGLTFRFATPNSLSRWRAATFSSKEPETLEWIDSIPDGSVLWDVGANVGLYSVYAAKRRSCRVFSFEPSVFNLELLARNIALNGVVDRVCIVPLALSDELGPQRMRMTTTEWGGALSTFGKEFGWDGKAIRSIFEFQTMGLPVDDVEERLGIPGPAYIKMDVDGLEHFILKGGARTLSRVAGILIEVNDDFLEQADQISALLAAAGLVLSAKRHSQMIAASTTGFAASYNQIWVRA